MKIQKFHLHILYTIHYSIRMYIGPGGFLVAAAWTNHGSLSINFIISFSSYCSTKDAF